mgnify:CR=1 FL=1
MLFLLNKIRQFSDTNNILTFFFPILFVIGHHIQIRSIYNREYCFQEKQLNSKHKFSFRNISPKDRWTTNKAKTTWTIHLNLKTWLLDLCFSHPCQNAKTTYLHFLDYSAHTLLLNYHLIKFVAFQTRLKIWNTNGGCPFFFFSFFFLGTK